MREVDKVSKGPELYLVSHPHPSRARPRRRRLSGAHEDAAVEGAGSRHPGDRARHRQDLRRAFRALNAELLQGAEFRKADISFEREHVVDLGGVRARVMAMGANHTRSDIAVFVEPDRVLVSGDLVMMGLPQFTAPTARIATWLGTLDRFDALKPVRIVPSHGAMGDASMIAAYRAFLTTVRDRAAALKKDGKTIDETVRTLQDELQGALQPQPDGQRHPRRLQRGTIGPCTISCCSPTRGCAGWCCWRALAAIARAVSRRQHAPPLDPARRPRRHVVHRVARPADAARPRALWRSSAR